MCYRDQWKSAFTPYPLPVGGIVQKHPFGATVEKSSSPLSPIYCRRSAPAAIWSS